MATALNVSFNQEQFNYLRLCRAVIDLGTEVLRIILNRYVSPKRILQKANDKKLKLLPHQWQTLRTINVDYKELDFSFLYTLIRELYTDLRPTREWDPSSPPTASEVTLADDVERIHYIRNYLHGHIYETSISNKAFQESWNELENIMTRVDEEFNSNFQESILMMEMEEIDMKNIKKEHLADLKQHEIEHWLKDDKPFCETKASKKIASAVRTNAVTIITGSPGSGKSAIARHIALALQDQNYQIVPVKSAGDLEHSWVKGRKQVFVLDGTFGIHKLETAEIDDWYKRKEIVNLCSQHNRIIVTMRKECSRDKRLLTLFSECQYSMVDITQDELLLSGDEKRSMFTKHMSVAKKQSHYNDTIKNCKFSFFPLLCKLFATDNESKYELNMFFRNPLSVLKSEFELLRENKDAKYLGLVLCALYDNKLAVDMLYNGEESKETTNKCKDLAKCCGFSKPVSHQEIKTNLESLSGTYLVKEYYHYFKHDLIHDALLSTLTPDFQEFILKHCSSKFINQRVVLSPVQPEMDDIQPFIVLDNTLRQMWLDRLILDINRGNYLDVFLNTCLKDEKIEELFLNQLKNSTFSKHDFLKIIHCSEMQSESVIPNIQPYPFLLESDLKATFGEQFFFMFLENNTGFSLVELMVANNLNKVFFYVFDMLSDSEKEALISDDKVIYIAAFYGNKVVFNLCLDKINFTEDKILLLLTSLLGGHVEIVKKVLKKINENDRCTFEIIFCFLVAALLGYDEIIEFLICRSYINFDLKLKDILPTATVQFDCKNVPQNLDELNYDCSDVLFQTLMNNLLRQSLASLDVMSKCRQGITEEILFDIFPTIGSVLLCLTSLSGHDSILQVLIKNFLSVNRSATTYAIALNAASVNGHASTVQKLLYNGAEVNTCDYNGNTALHLASFNGHDSVIKTLIQKGANVTKLNKNCKNALHLASQNGHDNVVKSLLENGAGTECNDNGNIALHLASENGHNNVVKTLIEKGAKVNGCDINGNTALHLASYNGHDDVVKTLIENGTRVNEYTIYSNALHLAAFNGHVNVVQKLMGNCVLVTNCNENGSTAFQLSSINRHYSSVSFLTDVNVNQCTSLLHFAQFGDELIVKALIESGANVNASYNDGVTALHLAACHGHDSVVKTLIQNRAKVNKCNNNGDTALHVASQRGHDFVVKTLIQKGAYVSYRNYNGVTALDLALYNGHDIVVNTLIENGASVTECDNHGVTPLHFASQNGHDSVVETLIENGANVTECNNNGVTALHLASFKGHDSVVKTLIENGADVNKYNKYDTNALHLASLNGHDTVVKTLIGNGADTIGRNFTALHLASLNGHNNVAKTLIKQDATVTRCKTNSSNRKTWSFHGGYVDTCDNNGNTALHLASYNGHDNVVKTLIEHGANETECNNNGVTALHLASENGHDNIVKTLKKNGANITVSDNHGDTALHFASYNGHVKVVKTLIENGANVNGCNNNGDTALHLASLNGHINVTKTLIENGANVTGYNKISNTALHLASHNGNVNVVKTLIENGANVTECNNNGATALHFASENGHGIVVKTLIQNGANVTECSNSGFTALHLASINGHDHIVKTLIENGANVTDCKINGVTALNWASINGHDNVVKTLIENGANVTDCKNNGITALHCASINGHDNVVKTLIENGANVTECVENGNTALHFASENGHDKVVRTLIENGANVFRWNKCGATALGLALYNRHGTVAKTLTQEIRKKETYFKVFFTASLILFFYTCFIYPSSSAFTTVFLFSLSLVLLNIPRFV